MFNAFSVMFNALLGIPLMPYTDIIEYIQDIPTGGGAYVHLLNPQLMISSAVYILSSLLLFTVFIFIPLKFLLKKRRGGNI